LDRVTLPTDMTPVTVLLDNIRSLHNVGSMFRSGDGAGIEGLILSGYTGIPPRDQIKKVALGAEEVLPWKQEKDPLVAVEELRGKGYQIVALETGESAVDLMNFEPEWPLCLMVGNEVEGLQPELLESADAVVKIPMFGQKESLNVSCAFSVAVYELYRKHQKRAL